MAAEQYCSNLLSPVIFFAPGFISALRANQLVMLPVLDKIPFLQWGEDIFQKIFLTMLFL